MLIALLSETYPSANRPDVRSFVHERARLYAAAGHTVAAFSQSSPNEPHDEVRDAIPILRAGPEELLVALRRFAPDVLVFHTPYTGTSIFSVASLLAKKFPTVLWMHGYETLLTGLHGYHSGVSTLLSLPWDARKLWGLRRLARRCAGVVYVSAWLRRRAEQNLLLRHPNTHVIHNPVDLGRFRPPAAPRIRKLDEPLAAISLRGLRRVYGHDVTIRAFVGVQRCNLTIAGSGPLEADLSAMIRRTGSPARIMTQPILHDDMPEFLAGFDFFVAASRSETQGVAMCEAMACGLPVIAARVGGIPEFVRDEVDGFLVPPNSPSNLRSALERLLHDRAELRRMGENAATHIAALCDANHVVEAELQVLENAAKRSGKV